MTETKKMQLTVGEETISFETGKIARQANGAVMISAGETMLLCTATAAPEPAESVDFFPLRVDYQEKFSAAGKTLGGFFKREGRPSEREVLLSRLIDRPLRPMFEDGYFNETQLLCTVYSFDGTNITEPLAICGASAALAISDIPLSKPIAAVRVGFIDGKFVVNPTVQHQEKSTLDLMIAGTQDAVLMIEGYCNFFTEEQVLEAINTGHQSIKKICESIETWAKQIGKEKNRSRIKVLSEDVLKAVEEIAKPHLDETLRVSDKKMREEALDSIKTKVTDKLLPKDQEPLFDANDVKLAFKKTIAAHMRNMVVAENFRSDGRKTDEVRKIAIEQSLLPRVHGSTLFTRGETQTIAVCTLGGESMAQRFEDLLEEGLRRFYLHYTFPSYSVGEVGRVGPPGRREVGHGKLAERALQYVIPPREQFPYTIRIESNITESNGSSSMASVCGGCLAMMDAGVPIARPVSGIAMGLILEKGRHVILSDILGIEDALGDMDFKITGDKEGITAFQMDIKVEGITIDIMRDALNQARQGRIHILDKMLEICPTSKTSISKHAPRLEILQIKPSKIGTVIGPGGKQIRAIVEETGVDIDIDDNGSVSIASNDLESLEKAKKIILALTAEAEKGQTYKGKVTSIKDFGLFVEILPGIEGLCHISEFDHMRINNLNEHIKQGDEITVKVLEIDERGKIKLSRKALIDKKA